jgi:hypothetical protein
MSRLLSEPLLRCVMMENREVRAIRNGVQLVDRKSSTGLLCLACYSWCSDLVGEYEGAIREATSGRILGIRNEADMALDMAIWLCWECLFVMLGAFSIASQVAGPLAMTSHCSKHHVLKHRL